MFKSKQEIIVIQAEAADPITTGVVFWSHDKGTAKLLFQLKKDSVNQTLAEGTIVPICLVFIGGRHIYHAVIEDAINGIVSIVLEDNILGYVGRVEGSIYIELPDSRSLDTAGRFTFQIKRSPIDEDVPELEDYYWQGFNEIMNQYHGTIAEIKSEAKTLLDSLTADVTTAQNKVTTLEQSITTANTNLNTRINEINKKIDDNDVFTKQESSANVIDQIVGKESDTRTITLDLNGKIAGSNVENPNYASYKAAPTLQAPSSFGADNYVTYDKLYKVDSNTLNLANATNGNRSQFSIQFNVIEAVTRELGEAFFVDQGATDVLQKVELIKGLIDSAKYISYGLGIGPTGNKLTTSIFSNTAKTYLLSSSVEGSVIGKMTSEIEVSSLNEFISSDGWIYLIVYAEASNGTTSSSMCIDYASIELTLNLSANAHIKSMIANNHVENLATPEEAKAGTDTTRTMTPATTAQSIDNRAVTLASNQTIGGIKNFKDGLMINDVSLSTITRKVIYEADGVGGYFNAADKFTLGASGKIDKIVLLWSRVDDTAGTLLNYSWSQTVLSPDDLVVGNSYRIQMTTDNYKFVTFANESGNVTISGANENSVAPNRIYRIKRIIAYLKN